MARYRKWDLRTWNDEKFRELSPLPPSGQSLWVYLILGPQTTNIPGLFEGSEVSMADRLGWSLEAFREAFREASGKGMAKADWKARLVWLPKAPKYNKPESPNVLISWGAIFDELPECDLKRQAYQVFKAFAKGWGEGYAKAFGEAWVEPSAKAMPNQEQEQEQEQEQSICGAHARENGFDDDQEGREPGPPIIELTDAEHHAQFERIKAVYPKFIHRQDWLNAEVACRNHVGNGDATWDSLIAVTDRYANHIRAKGDEGTQYVKTPGKFFTGNDGDAFWRQEWPLPLPANGKSRPAPAPVKYRTADEIEAEERARGDYDAQH